MKPEEAIEILQKRIDLIDTEYPDQKDLMEYRKALDTNLLFLPRMSRLLFV